MTAHAKKTREYSTWWVQKEKKSKPVIWTLLKASHIAKCSSRKCFWSMPGAHMTGWFHQRSLATPENEKQAQESAWEHVHPMCTWAWATPQAGSGCTLLSSSVVLKKKLFLRQWRGNAHVLALHVCKTKQNTVRGTGAGPCYFCTGPVSPRQEGDRSGYFSVNFKLINLSTWPIMKEVSKTKVTSVSRHERSIFFSSGKKT